MSNKTPAWWSVGLVLAAAVFAVALTDVRDVDAWWQIKAGEAIWRGGIPRLDPFSYVLAGTAWVDHEWLAQALFYKALAGGGAAGLIAFKAAVLALGFWLAWGALPGRPLWSAAALLLAAWAMRGQMVVRPIIFDCALLGGLSALLWRLDFRRPPKRLRWLLPALGALWVNLHGGAALLLPVLLAAAVGAEWLRERSVPLKIWAGLIAASAAALLLNPYGWRIFAHLAATLSFAASPLLVEWRPPLAQLPGIYGAFLLLGAAAAWRLRKERPFAAAWLLLLGAASLRMQRNVPLFLLTAAPALAAAVPERWSRPGPRWAPVFYLLASLGSWAHGHLAYPWLMRRYHFALETPLAGAAAFVERAGLSGRMFNTYTGGGELIYHLWPERKVFIDSRAVEYGGGLITPALFWYRPEIWRRLDAKFRFDYAVLRRDPSGAYTARVFDEDAAWRLVYFDDEGMVYARGTPGNARIIAERAYRHVQPGRGNLQYVEAKLRAGQGPALLAELERSLGEHPKLGVSLLLRPYVLMRLGRPEDAVAAAEMAVERLPERAQPRLTLAWLREARGEHGAAEEVYRAGLARVRPGERPTIGADILTNLGRLRERAGDKAGARRHYRKALRWGPAHRAARHNLNRL